MRCHFCCFKPELRAHARGTEAAWVGLRPPGVRGNRARNSPSVHQHKLMLALKREKNPATCIAQRNAARRDTRKGFRSTARAGVRAGDRHRGDPRGPAPLTRLCPGHHGARGGCVGLGQHPLPTPTAGTLQGGPRGLPGSSGERSWERHLSPGGVSPPAEPRQGLGSPSLTKAERSFRLLFRRGDANLQQSEFKKKLKIAVHAREPGWRAAGTRRVPCPPGRPEPGTRGAAAFGL